MERPLVSTLTSCYKAQKYLPLFLERLPEQTYFDRLEVVIDMNEPSEEELSVVRDFQDRHPGRLKVLVQEKVVPYSASWNNCIRAASGEYLAVWNLDDLRTPGSIEAQARYLAEHPEKGIVHGRYRVVPKFGSTDGYVKDTTTLPRYMATKRFVFGPFYMFRKGLIAKAGYVDEQFRSSADFDHTIRLSMHADFGAVEEDLGYYLMAGEGLSNRPDSPIEVENFVIRMRYGIYDNVWYHYLPMTINYDFYNIVNGAERIPVAAYVPEYRKFLEERYRMYFDLGLIHHLSFKTKERWFGLDGLVLNLRSRR